MFRRVKATAAVAAALVAATGCATLAAPAAQSSRWAAAALAALAISSLLRPVAAVLIVAALVPVATTAMTLGLQRVGVWSEALVAAALAGWFLRVGLRRDRVDRPAVAAAAAVLATITVMSLAVELAEWRARLSPEAFWPALAETLRHYTTDRGGIGGLLRSAARLLEGIALCVMVATVCRAPDDRRRVLRMIAVGAAAAAAFNANRLLAGALRSETPWTTMLSLVRMVRVSLPYGDVNAAGSYFALTSIVSVALAWTSRRAPFTRGLWILVIAMNVLGLWLSQSRTAVLAMALVVAAAALLRVRRRRAAILGAIVAATALVVWIFPNPILDRSSIGAVGIRAELARVAWRLTSTSPVFGIGIGQFYDQSGQYIQDPYVRSLYPNENAHNNFLQILAELGVVGLAAFLWLLVEIFVAGLFRLKAARPFRLKAEAAEPETTRTLSRVASAFSRKAPVSAEASAFTSENPSPLSRVASAFRRKNHTAPANDQLLISALTIAAATFLLTCAGGHPLLIEEVAFTFWCAAGVMLSATPPAAGPSPRAAPRVLVAAAAIAVLVVLLPWRMAKAAETTDLEHVGYGVSSWLREEDGTRYRRTSGDATLFVPANARAVDIPLRLLSASDPVTVEIVFRNRVGDRIVVAAPAWQTYRLMLAPGRSEARFVPVRLRVVSGDPHNLAIGRTVGR